MNHGGQHYDLPLPPPRQVSAVLLLQSSPREPSTPPPIPRHQKWRLTTPRLAGDVHACPGVTDQGLFPHRPVCGS